MSTNSPDNTGYAGFADPNSRLGEFNQVSFAVQQALTKLQTCLPVIVIAQYGGALEPVGFVDIQPLVQQVNPDGSPTDHGVITNVPYFRLQGGSNAVIIDPVKGDIGMACFASRDISSVKNARAKAHPGSSRRYDMSDALYLGGVLNAAPTQYIQFSAAGIKLYSPTLVEIDAPQVNVNATSSATVTTPTSTVNATTAAINASGSATLTAPAVSLGSSGGTLQQLIDQRILAWLSSHTHKVTAVGSDTNPPTQALPTCTTSATKAS